VLHILLADILCPKIVNDEGEADGTGVVFPETGGCLALTISMLFEAFLEQLLGDDTSVWQAVHPLLYLPVDIAIGGGFVAEIIVLDDAVWHVGDAQAHILVSGHWGIEIKILDVHLWVCRRRRDNALCRLLSLILFDSALQFFQVG
jgi:hypothetical protein